MKRVVSGQGSVVSFFGRLFCLLVSTFCLLACSVPNLEEPACDEARSMVREFYSFHFGNEMAFTPDGLEKRKEYLTPQLYESLKSTPPGLDPLTRTDDLPKAFRVGQCRVVQPVNRVIFDLVLFWKTDTRSEERSIDVEAVRLGDKWRIAAVTDKAER